MVHLLEAHSGEWILIVYSKSDMHSVLQILWDRYLVDNIQSRLKSVILYVTCCGPRNDLSDWSDLVRQ
jgi:hypothetical protein